MNSNSVKKFLVILSLLTVGVIWHTMSGMTDQYPITNFPPKGTKVIALGDSLTTGVGASTKSRGYIELLEQRFAITIINKALIGDTTHDALARLDVDVIRQRPDIVLILLGSNDYLRQEPRADTFQNLRTIITSVQKTGAVVILIGARGGILSDTFAEDFAALARSTGSAFVPGILDGILGDSKYMYDEIHPNDAGYLKMADKVAPVLDRMILAAKGIDGR